MEWSFKGTRNATPSYRISPSLLIQILEAALLGTNGLELAKNCNLNSCILLIFNPFFCSNHHHFQQPFSSSIVNSRTIAVIFCIYFLFFFKTDCIPIAIVDRRIQRVVPIAIEDRNKSHPRATSFF